MIVRILSVRPQRPQIIPSLNFANEIEVRRFYFAGTYLPDLNSVYGNDMAFKLGPRGSDRDSIISSEMSFFQPEPNSMR